MNYVTKANAGLLVALGVSVVVACGSDGSEFPGGGTSGTPGSSGGTFPVVNGGSGDPGVGDVDLASMRVEPANAVLTLTPGQALTQPYKLLGKLKNQTQEIDLTSRSVFYVPDNYVMGGFPLDGSSLYTSRLPAASADPPQRGGVATVRATIANADGPHDATTTLTLTLNLPAIVRPGAPADAASKFGGTVSAGRAPTLVYPNNGTMLPPNLRRLEVHWRAQGGTDLYQISFRSAVGEVTYYSRCIDNAGAYLANSCAFELDEIGYNALAYSNGGQGPVTLRVRGTNAADPATLGESAEFQIEFAQNRVDGGLYYWTVVKGTDSGRIMRFDFGAATGQAEPFLRDGECAGCHALSRDGTKMVASLKGIDDGRLVYSNDITKITYSDKPQGIVNQASFTRFGDGENRLQFASFNPDGSRFVAVFGDRSANNGAAPPNFATDPGRIEEQKKLFFYDGTSGLRTSSLARPVRPNHPDWSADGKMIAVTRVNNADNSDTQRTTAGSIEIIPAEGAGWGAPREVVAKAENRNRFNPNFVPDSSFLIFTESECAGPNDDTPRCDSDSDIRASTFAVPSAGGAPVYLRNANTRGVIDDTADLGDTFPRSAPFQTAHRGGKLFWFTVASRRKAGLRKQEGAQHLWMFAVDPAKVLAGQDGSYTGFYVPSQDLGTSNHIGQWAEKIVGGSQPPAPAPPTPPPPPVPPGPR